MTRRALPLLIDALPLYATQQQLVAAMAATAEGQKCAAVFFQMKGFPKPTLLMGSLFYVPAVLSYVENFEEDRPTNSKGVVRSWQETSKRRG